MAATLYPTTTLPPGRLAEAAGMAATLSTVHGVVYVVVTLPDGRAQLRPQDR